MTYRIGFIGMVGEELRRDLWGTLQHMAALGYQGIEGAALVRDSATEMQENRRRLADLGMATVALSCSHQKEAELGAVIARAQALGCRYIVDYWAAPETREGVLALAEQLERMAATCAAEGVTFLYHNHEHEFVPKFGPRQAECMFDLLYANTDALRFELDVAWCHFGGSDPVAVLRRCGRRIPVLHIKDLSDDHIRGHFCAVGMGKVPCFAAMEAGAAKGTEWMVVEQDTPGHLPLFESATASILNIREAGLHPSLG
jgi:sugar phosphate isomerase/epimerase